MPNALTDSTYQKLISDISQIYETAKQKALVAANDIFNLARWEIGRKLVEEEQHGNFRAKYAERTLERVSWYLTQKFGRGFSISNLKYMRQFYLSYQIRQPVGEFGWTLHCVLLTIKDDNKRNFYEKKTRELGWSKRELIQQIHRDRIELIRFSGRNSSRSSKPHSSKPALEMVTRGLLYTYKLIYDQEKDCFCVDCGFTLDRNIPIKYSTNPKEGDIVESVQTETGFYTKTSERSEDDLYTYQAFVREIIDGDTLKVKIDLGFESSTRQKLRLRGIDCPEIDTPKGKEAAEFVKARLENCKFIIVRTYEDKSDKYGRYLADIFYLPTSATGGLRQVSLPNETDPAVVAAEGIFLNQELLDNGLAKIWQE